MLAPIQLQPGDFSCFFETRNSVFEHSFFPFLTKGKRYRITALLIDLGSNPNEVEDF